MKRTSRRRISAELKAVIILVALAAPMATPISRKHLGNNSGFLRNLGFLSRPSASLGVWCLALAVTAAYIAFAVKNAPPAARTWIQPPWPKLVVMPAALAVTNEWRFETGA